MTSVTRVAEPSTRAPALEATRQAWAAARPRERGVALAAGFTGATGAVSWTMVAPVLVALAVGASVAALVPAAVVDLAERRLPNGIVLAAAAPVVVAGLVSALSGDAAGGGAVIGAGLVAGPLLATHLMSPAGLGFGDVKAGTVLGGGLGLISPVLSVAALIVGLALTALVALAAGRRTIPLGPGLVAGAVSALIGGRLLGVTPW